jgi:hypothetical protein
MQIGEGEMKYGRWRSWTNNRRNERRRPLLSRVYFVGGRRGEKRAAGAVVFE